MPPVRPPKPLWLGPLSSCSELDEAFTPYTKVLHKPHSVSDGPCFVWKGFPTFRSHLWMRPVSRRHARRGLMGGSTFRRTPISRSPLYKIPMPAHLFELHPVNEVNTKG